MESIYRNSLGEEVKIKTEGGYCILHVQEEHKNTAEIAIPAEYAVGIAMQIIDHCEVVSEADPEAIRKTNSRLLRLLELIEIYNVAGVLKEEFEAFADYREEPIDTIDGLISAMEEEMSYWEPEGPESENS